MARLKNMLGFGSKSSPSDLASSLKRATESSSIDLPKEALLAIVQASFNEDDRRSIMRHIACCLTDAPESKWRRLYLATFILDNVMKDGPRELLMELTTGVHFDLIQRMSFLTKYEHSTDERVQGLIRRLAQQVRQAYLDFDPYQLHEDLRNEEKDWYWRPHNACDSTDDSSDEVDGLSRRKEAMMPGQRRSRTKASEDSLSTTTSASSSPPALSVGEIAMCSDLLNMDSSPPFEVSPAVEAPKNSADDFGDLLG